MVYKTEFTYPEIREFINTYIDNTKKSHGINSKALTIEFFKSHNIKILNSTKKHGVAIRIGKTLSLLEQSNPELVHKISQNTYIITPRVDSI